MLGAAAFFLAGGRAVRIMVQAGGRAVRIMVQAGGRAVRNFDFLRIRTHFQMIQPEN